MNTKLLMISSAILMGVIGLALTFLPHELAEMLNLPVEGWSILILQVLGAQYVAFAMVNWMAKSNLIGGIYSKPVAIGNFVHFMISSLALIKGAVAGEVWLYWMVTGVYAIFTLAFGYISFSDPLKKSKG